MEPSQRRRVWLVGVVGGLALVGLVVVLAAYRSVPTRWRWVPAAFFVACHCFLTAAVFPEYYFVPFGLAIVANVFVLGLMFRAIVASKAPSNPASNSSGTSTTAARTSCQPLRLFLTRYKRPRKRRWVPRRKCCCMATSRKTVRDRFWP